MPSVSDTHTDSSEGADMNRPSRIAAVVGATALMMATAGFAVSAVTGAAAASDSGSQTIIVPASQVEPIATADPAQVLDLESLQAPLPSLSAPATAAAKAAATAAARSASKPAAASNDGDDDSSASAPKPQARPHASTQAKPQSKPQSDDSSRYEDESADDHEYGDDSEDSYQYESHEDSGSEYEDESDD